MPLNNHQQTQTAQLFETSLPAPAAGERVTFSFAHGVVPNADYAVRLVARDRAGNCQPRFTTVRVHTADNVPPVTVGLRADNVTGSTAQLEVRLDEPGRAYFAVVAAAAADGANASASASASCPSAEAVFDLGSGTRPITAGAGPAAVVAVGSVNVTARAPASAVALLEGLASETAYVACVAAEDATQARNRQGAVSAAAFATLDVTPPAVTVQLAPSPDGDATCARAAPYACNATWIAAFSEAGSARWALLRNDALMPGAPLPSPRQVLAAPQLDSVLPAAAIVAEGRLSAPPLTSAPVQLASLQSGVSYTLVLAARDNAQPQFNALAALVTRAIAPLDVCPPTFLDVAPQPASDLVLAVALRLDEPATTFGVVTAAAAPAPNVAEVLNGTTANGTAPSAAGSIVTASANATVALSLAGLAPGGLYDVHLAAVDAAGNRQLRVTTLR